MCFSHLFVLLIFDDSSVLFIAGEKLKTFYLNKYSTLPDQSEDCLHTPPENFSIPPEFTFCYRQKPVKMRRYATGLLYIGNVDGNWEANYGIIFGVYSKAPWAGVQYGSKIAWVDLGVDKGIPYLMAWRHSCLTINLTNGQTTLYENGELRIETQSDHFFKIVNRSMMLVSLGCSYQWYSKSDIGSLTDFQLFSRILTKSEMEKWTGCKERFHGDIVSWDVSPWIFNTTGNLSEMEYLEFEEKICDLSDTSMQLLPISSSFPDSLFNCEKIDGKLME